MNIAAYKQSIKTLVDATNDEQLLSFWKERMEWEGKHKDEIELNNQEWQLVEEGLDDIKNGNTISFESFLAKRNK
jgi:hypothetical protein